jgi:serine/threonine protein kinase
MTHYKYGEVLFSSANTIIQQATREEDEKQFVVKKPSESLQTLPPFSLIESFKRDFQFSKILHSSYPDYFINMIEILEQKNGSIFLIEEQEGVSLKRLLEEKQSFPLEEFLKTARDMAYALQLAHSKQVLHLDVKLANFISKSENKVKLIDFGISTMVTRKSPSISCVHPTGTLHYMSPEQTGRISKNVDFRSDIYALGICFYEMLTGNLPFKGDKIALVHAQISKKLPLIPNVPEIVNKVIQRMCAKNPSERYYSASGIVGDLDLILQHLDEILKSNFENFQVGSFDVKEFQIPNKLYGRVEELKELKKSMIDPKNNMCLVSGSSGMGKSKLVEELLKDQELHLLMAYGKFDQFNRLTPYSAFIRFDFLTHLI